MELAARFCTDALEERYFAWDPDRFATRSAHARQRARAQLALGRAVARAQWRLERLAAAAMAG